MDKSYANPIGLAGNTGNLTTPKSWTNLEPEMLIKIFARLHSPTKPKETASCRLVCKHWKDVIDEHFEYWLTIDDSKFDLENISHVRTCSCTIVSLTEDVYPQQQIFKCPKLLTKLSVWGDISSRNFHLVIQEAVNLKCLSLNCNALKVAELMDDPSPASPEQEKRVQEFWNGLLTLKVSLYGESEEPLMIENVCKMLSRTMQNLVTLEMRIWFHSSDWTRIIASLYSFLENSSNQNLKTFHFTNELLNRLIAQPELSLRFSGVNQLESLRIFELCEELVPYWIPVIEAQRQLKDLRLNFRESFSTRDLQFTRFFQMVRTTLLRNQSTLSSVELTKLNLADDLDANVFLGMEKLTRLVLRPCKYEGRVQQILNLHMLPSSIETLELGNVIIESEELRLLVDKLDDIKVFQLLSTRITAESVMKGVLEMLSMKEKIRRITVYPFNFWLTFPCVREGSKRFLLVNGHEMELLWDGNVPSVHSSFSK